MNKEAIRLLDRLYKDLYKSDEVINHGSGNVYDKFNNIENYISDLESMHKRVSETGRHKDYLKKLYYDKYVIKKEDIKESYYQHQQEIALERGYGHVEITEQQKRQMQEEIINNQKARLDTWLDYFLSTDANVYPFWAKYWAFQGMLKLGTYDKEKGTFNRRTKDTIEPFCDLNREALSMSIDMLIKMLKKEEINDKELEILVKTGSFQKIYTYILNKVLKDNKNITKRNIGKWVKYDQGSDHMPLVNSLQGYNTGWCTAGESTAKSQLEQGDFYVYYTLDENDEYKVPRIAIRMEYDEIAEIRGIAQDQNLESEMEEVVEEKIKDFPDKEKYYKKVNDMKLLTHIYKKQQNKEELTKEELRFLYEIDSKIIGFGYDMDPRIEEIKNERGRKKQDLVYFFDCNESQIAFELNEMTDNTIYYEGDFYLDKEPGFNGLKLPKIIKGNLDLSGLTSAKGLVLPEKIGGDLDLAGLISTDGLVLPQNIGGNLDLSGLESAKGLNLPSQIEGNLYLDGLKSVEFLNLPNKIGGLLDLSKLESAEGLELPKSIGGDLYLDGIKSTKGLNLPSKIGGSLYLNRLTSVEGLELPQSIRGSLNLSGITSTEGLVLPQSIGGSLYLGGLTSAEGLVLPQRVGGHCDLSSLTSTKRLVLPQSIGGSLFLNNLTSAEDLELPQRVGGYCDLSNLTSVEYLVLPQSIDGALGLYSLNSLEDLIIPDPLTYEILMEEFKITPENVDQYRKSKKK